MRAAFVPAVRADTHRGFEVVLFFESGCVVEEGFEFVVASEAVADGSWGVNDGGLSALLDG